MTEPLSTDRPLVEPVYAQVELNEAIELAPVDVVWNYKGTSYEASACVTMQFTPDVRLVFVAATGEQSLPLALRLLTADDWDGKITLRGRDTTLDMFCVSATGSPSGSIVFTPRRSVVTPTPPSVCLTNVTFHLFNFPDFVSESDYLITRPAGPQPTTSWTRCGRLVLSADGWDITIAATDKTTDLCNRLRKQGGFVITHIGSVQRTDGSSFSSDQLQELLDCLHHFLSFTLGRWAGVALPIGFASNGDKVFEQWGMPLAAKGSWAASSSWFDAHNGQRLAEVFREFCDLWQDSTWQPALHAALYWYIAANDRAAGIGVDAGIILGQVALERLAWTYCVMHKRMVSKKAFSRGGLSAADRLRLLFSNLGIPAEIPSQLTALRAKRGQKWDGAPDAISSIRNTLVHPGISDSPSSPPYFEAWRLSMWLLDLVLLGICGHDGGYSNRLTGQVEMVPWVSEGQREDGKAD